MRSVNEPRVPLDAIVEVGESGRAQAVNLSTGGIFVAAQETLAPGEHVRLKVNLHDGAPLDVDGEVVWRADGGMALRFVNLDDMARRRIQRLVQKREPTPFQKRDVRIHLPSLNAPLRASARDLSERGIMLEAELPWLRLGSEVTTELSPERACEGRVQWIGLDVTRSGSARLRIFVDLTDDAAGGVSPPATAFAADDAMLARGRRSSGASWGRWLWPSLAVAGLLTCGGLTAALLRRPPVPALLPTAPPERDAPVAHLPKQLKVPTEQPEVIPDGPQPQPKAQTPAPSPSKPAHAKPAKGAKKRARVTPRAG